MNSFDVSLHTCLDAKSHFTMRTFVRLFAFVNDLDVPGKAVGIGEFFLADFAVDDGLDVAELDVQVQPAFVDETLWTQAALEGQLYPVFLGFVAENKKIFKIN
jgi:hypothetical protein